LKCVKVLKKQQSQILETSTNVTMQITNKMHYID